MIDQIYTPATEITIRKASLRDVMKIIDLFADEVRAGRMLPRKAGEIRRHIGLWQVAIWKDEIIGCVSLVFFNPELCEVRSLAVAESHRGQGLGERLVAAGIDLARKKQATHVLTLTRATNLFEKLGFKHEEVFNFPQKVWRDCKPCPFFHNCDEVALVYTIEESKEMA